MVPRRLPRGAPALRIARQLNKGENLHALRRTLAYAGEGAVRRRHHEQRRPGFVLPERRGSGRSAVPE